MKVLGLSFGRKMKNCEILVKEALMGAEKLGAEVSFIRMINLDIKHCVGCGACSGAMKKGKQIKCILKDDYNAVVDAILDADAVIIAAPVYVLAPTGQFKNFVDRFVPAHDGMALEAEENRRRQTGAEPLDPREFKLRYVGYISVGGAVTHNWVSFGIPGMQLFNFTTHTKVIDQIDANDMGRRGSPVLDKALIERANRLGQNIAGAVGKNPNEVGWKGDDEGICPVCHCNLLSVGKTTTVECPICGITGKLSVEGDKVKVEFSDKQRQRARGTRNGQQEHVDELDDIVRHVIPKLQAAKDTLPALLSKYEGYHEINLKK